MLLFRFAVGYEVYPAEDDRMPGGDKSKYTETQKRQAEHIEGGYEERGVSERERRVWATDNKMSGGGKKSGSGRGHAVNKEPARKGGLGGAASAARPKGARSTLGKKAAHARKTVERFVDASLPRRSEAADSCANRWMEPDYIRSRFLYGAVRPLDSGDWNERSKTQSRGQPVASWASDAGHGLAAVGLQHGCRRRRRRVGDRSYGCRRGNPDTARDRRSVSPW